MWSKQQSAQKTAMAEFCRTEYRAIDTLDSNLSALPVWHIQAYFFCRYGGFATTHLDLFLSAWSTHTNNPLFSKPTLSQTEFLCVWKVLTVNDIEILIFFVRHCYESLEKLKQAIALKFMLISWIPESLQIKSKLYQIWFTVPFISSISKTSVLFLI